MKRWIVWALALVCLLTLPAGAQEAGSSALSESMKPLIEQAKKEGATIMVIAPGGTADGEQAAVKDPSLTDILMRTRFRLGLVVKGAGEFFHKAQEVIARQSPQGTGWLLWTVLVSVAAIIAGRLVAKPVAIWAGNMFTPRAREVPHTRSYKLSLVLFTLVVFWVIAAIAGIVAALIVIAYAGDDEAVRTTGLIIVACYIGYRFVRGVSWGFLRPSHRPAYRPFAMPDQVARQAYIVLQVAVGIGIAMLGLCVWMFRLGLDDNAHKLALIVATGAIALMLSGWAIRFRQSVAQAIRGEGSEDGGSWWVSTLARSWHVLVVLYMGIAWVVASIRILLDLPQGPNVVGDPILAGFVCVVGYCIALIVIDKFLGETWLIEEERPEPAPAEAEVIEAVAEPEAARERLVIAEDDDDNEFAMPQVIAEDEPDKSVPLSVFKPLAEHAAVIIALITGAVMTAAIWGVDFHADENIFVRFIDIIIIGFIAYIAYRAVNVWVAEKRALEGDFDSSMPDEDMMGGGASRFLTLLPMFRNFLLITIVVIGGMMVLSELGVDIGPLFAGAGVVGLAIGFGAQTLIRDVFSGAFFLIDDAFRKGEYIDIGNAKGTVEKISIRSFQLRHHRGALNTVPFGEIKQITNYSRDWVMMKLPIRVTYDTDLEMLRKLVKRLGIELLEDEDIGHKFLQPLKSQGALEMGDSAIIIRLKFMTKPGDQFSVRTKVLTKIRELFEEKGIKFAHREVTVRVAQAEEVAEMTGAAAGAAAAVAIASDAEQQPQPQSADKP